MHEYLIADYTNYDQPGDEVVLHLVSLEGLFKEVQKAIDDRLYCIAVYQVQEQCFLDFSTPRPLDE